MTYAEWYAENYDVHWDLKCAEAYGNALKIEYEYIEWCEQNNTHPKYD